MSFVKPLSPAVDAIVSSLAFFAMFSRPLTKEEVVQYSYIESGALTKEEIVDALTQTSDYWKHDQGYFYLQGVGYDMPLEDMQKVSNHFLQKSKRYLLWLRHIPYVRLVAVANTVAFGSAKEDSDIDLFIVTKNNKVWIARLLVTGVLHVLGVRRHGMKTKGRFCLSFFADESVLDLSSIALQPQDIYLSYWLATLIPVWSTPTYDDLLYANHTSLLAPFPLWKKREVLVPINNSKNQQIFETILSFPPLVWLGKRLIDLQKSKMKCFPVAQNEFSSVIVSDHVLKFHNNDRRGRYQKEWEQRTHTVISRV